MVSNASEVEWTQGSNGKRKLEIMRKLYVTHGILKYGGYKIVIPEQMKIQALEWHHSVLLAGHRGHETVLFVVFSESSSQYITPFTPNQMLSILFGDVNRVFELALLFDLVLTTEISF